MIDKISAIAQQRLTHREAQAGIEVGVQQGVAAVGRILRGRKSHRVLRAGGQDLAHAEASRLAQRFAGAGAGEGGHGRSLGPGIAEIGIGRGIPGGQSPHDGVLRHLQTEHLDLDIGIVGHHQFQIGFEREGEFPILDEVLQPYRVFEFHPGVHLGEGFAKVGRLRERRQLPERALRLGGDQDQNSPNRHGSQGPYRLIETMSYKNGWPWSDCHT